METTHEKLATLASETFSTTYLFESAWEVCNQVGGIYTVIQSKIPSVLKKWDYENYILLGPYVHDQVAAAFEPIEDTDNELYETVQVLRQRGYGVYFGNWLVQGKPQTILFDYNSIYYKLGEIKYDYWEHHAIELPSGDDLLDKVLLFGFLVTEFFREFSRHTNGRHKVLAHFHEWMAGTPIPILRRENIPAQIVFTTHATLLGRYLAMNDPVFYDHLPFYDWGKESIHFNIHATVSIERAAAHGAHIFTTVSDVTGKECEFLLGRKPDVILPNGLNIQRFEALHRFQNLHLTYKEQIHEFVMGHFFQSYSFDLDKTLYFFTSGRFEYQNKGYDLVLEALARLNWRMKYEQIDYTVVMFFITKRPTHSINPQVLQSRAVMQEIRTECRKIEEQVGHRLFYSVTSNHASKLPYLNDLVDEYSQLRLRRTIQAWKSINLPPVVTHNLVDDAKDEILNYLRAANLVNLPEDKVKIVYHPDFLAPSNPLFGMEYKQFVRGCHMGLFPSYYEPWGYTPLECIASGIPTVTTDLAGFGDYVANNIENHEEAGVYIVKRKHKSFHESADELADILLQFVKRDRRQRIAMRNLVESTSPRFDWDELGKFYDHSYQLAMEQATV